MASSGFPYFYHVGVSVTMKGDSKDAGGLETHLICETHRSPRPGIPLGGVTRERRAALQGRSTGQSSQNAPGNSLNNIPVSFFGAHWVQHAKHQ